MEEEDEESEEEENMEEGMWGLRAVMEKTK